MHQQRLDYQFSEVLWQSQGRVRACLAGLGVNRSEVDDLAQETFLELYRNYDKIPEGVPPERWVIGIARNVGLNYLRKTARRGRLHREALAELLAKTQTDVDRHAGLDDVGTALEQCLTHLPADRKRLLELKYQQDLSSTAIAQAVRSTAEAVRIALHRIRAGLRNCIARKLERDS